jgi:hypothetical protein
VRFALPFQDLRPSALVRGKHLHFSFQSPDYPISCFLRVSAPPWRVFGFRSRRCRAMSAISRFAFAFPDSATIRVHPRQAFDLAFSNYPITRSPDYLILKITAFLRVSAPPWWVFGFPDVGLPSDFPGDFGFHPSRIRRLESRGQPSAFLL